MIELRELTAGYGGPPVLEDVSLVIPDGEFLLLVGANGAGKTTLLHHCNGLLEPDAGEVRVNGRPVRADLVAARTAVGLVFQEPRDGFVAARVREDVAFGPENLGLDRAAIDRRVEAALAAVRLADRGDDRIDDLSGGERARLAVAGALAMEPDHLLLDEPLGGLDDRSRTAVVERLASLHGDGTSVVVAAHDLRDVWDPAERVVGLDGGEVVLDGSPEAVRDRLPSVGVRPPC